MKYLLILTVLLLSACVTAPESPGITDPYTLRQYGESLQEAADAQIEATKQAQVLEQQRRSMSVQATQAAWSIQVTQTSYAQSVQQTIDANNLQATQAAFQRTQEAAIAEQTYTAKTTEAATTAQAVQATSEAIALGVKYEQELMNKRIVWVGVREAIKALFMAAALIIIGLAMWKYVPIFLDWIIEWIDRRNTMFESRSGTAAFTMIDGVSKPVLLADMYAFRNRPQLDAGSDAAPVKLSANKVSATSPVQPNGWSPVIQQQAIALLKICDPNGVQIIPANKSGLSEDTWMQITDSMVRANLINKEPGKGTTVIDGTCSDVLFALEMKQVVLRPTPSRYAPVENCNA